MSRSWPLQYRSCKCVAPRRDLIDRGLFHDGYSCTVSGPPDEGYHLPVYGAERRGQTVTGWIESEANEAFEISICNSDETEKTPTCCSTYVDGELISGPIIGDGNLFNVADVRGIEDESGLRRMHFKPIKVTDNKKAATRKGSAAVSKLGLIRIELHRVKINGVKAPSEDGEEAQCHGLEGDVVVHESEKILDGHHVGLGEPEPFETAEEILDIDFLDEDPFIIFQFRYAPAKVLLSIEGLIPAPPTESISWADQPRRSSVMQNLPDLEEPELTPTPAPELRQQSENSATSRKRGAERDNSGSPPSGRQRKRVKSEPNSEQRDESQLEPEEPPAESLRRSTRIRRTRGGGSPVPPESGAQYARKRTKVKHESPEPEPEATTQSVPISPRNERRTKREEKREVKRESSAQKMDVALQDSLDDLAEAPLTDRTVKVDADDYVAALEAQNRALQALLPEHQRVLIIKNEPLNPMLHFKPGETVDLTDA